jgi:hypothetical protein
MHSAAVRGRDIPDLPSKADEEQKNSAFEETSPFISTEQGFRAFIGVKSTGQCETKGYLISSAISQEYWRIRGLLVELARLLDLVSPICLRVWREESLSAKKSKVMTRVYV